MSRQPHLVDVPMIDGIFEGHMPDPTDTLVEIFAVAAHEVIDFIPAYCDGKVSHDGYLL